MKKINFIKKVTPLSADTFNQMQNNIEEEFSQVNSQLAEIAIDPINYGAVGDGVTDDTSVIQNLLKSNVNLILNGRTYAIQPLTFTGLKNFKISNGKFKNLAGISSVELTNEPATLNFIACSNFELENIEIDSSGGEWTRRPYVDEATFNDYLTKRKKTYGGLKLYDCSNFTIDKVLCHHSRTGFYTADCIDGLFIQCEARYTQADGYYNTGSARNITLFKCKSIHVNDDCFTFLGYYDNSYPKDCFIDSCYAYDGHALGCLEGAVNCEIINSHGYLLRYTPIKLGGYNTGRGKNLRVINCTAKLDTRLNNLSSNYSPYFVNSNANDSEVANNNNYYFENSTFDFSLVENLNQVLLAKNCTDVTFKNCNIILPNTKNIAFENVCNLVVEGCTIIAQKIIFIKSNLALTALSNPTIIKNKFYLSGDIDDYIIHFAECRDFTLNENLYAGASYNKKVAFWNTSCQNYASCLIDTDYIIKINSGTPEPILSSNKVLNVNHFTYINKTALLPGQVYIDTDLAIKVY